MISLIEPPLISRSLDWRKKRRGTFGHNLLNGLVEFWPLDEQSGMRRGVHAGINLTDVNTVTGAPGVGSLASQFTKANKESFSVTSSPLAVGDIDYCHIGWIYLDATPVSASVLIAKNNQATARGYTLIMLPDLTANFLAYNGVSTNIGFATASTTLVVGTWNFLVSYHSATLNECGISLNGAAYDTVATTGAAGDVALPVTIGDDSRASGNVAHDGRIQRVGFYKGRILTMDDVTYHHNGGYGRNYPFI